VEFLWVGVGGFAGANARYALGRYLVDRLGAAFPYGTFLINISGSLLIGLALTFLTERYVTDPMWRLLLVIGFLGGYTTFSSYAFESIALLEQGHWSRALLYVIGSNALSLLACYGGMSLARALDG
jgi:CrcB protein